MAARASLVLVALLVLAGTARAQEKKDGTAAVSSPTTTPLPEPPAHLAKLLEVYDKEPEPQRSVKRLYASSLYYLLERDLDRFVACFHKDFQIHEGFGVVKCPLDELRKRVEKLWESTPKSSLKVEELVQLDKARAYSKRQAKSWFGDWNKEPSEIAKVMDDGDYMVIAPTNKAALGEKASDFDAEVFYVMRQENGVWKIVLGE